MGSLLGLWWGWLQLSVWKVTWSHWAPQVKTCCWFLKPHKDLKPDSVRRTLSWRISCCCRKGTIVPVPQKHWGLNPSVSVSLPLPEPRHHNNPHLISETCILIHHTAAGFHFNSDFGSRCTALLTDRDNLCKPTLGLVPLIKTRKETSRPAPTACRI